MSRLIGLDLEYNYRLAKNTNYGKARNTSNIKYIVIHYTGNDGDTDTSNGNYFANNNTGTSAHYFVDEDSCTQAVPDNHIAYHCESKGMKFKCGCRNANSIGVEMCSDVVNGEYVITERTKANALILTKWLMAKYNVPASNVIRHYDVCGKLCPEPWVRDVTEWQDFKNKLEEEDMTEAEVKKIATKVANDMIYDYKDKVYNKVEEVPEWGRATVKKLIKKGVLNGDEKGLNLSYTMLRMLIINDRAGLYD